MFQVKKMVGFTKNTAKKRKELFAQKKKFCPDSRNYSTAVSVPRECGQGLVPCDLVSFVTAALLAESQEEAKSRASVALGLNDSPHMS